MREGEKNGQGLIERKVSHVGKDGTVDFTETVHPFKPIADPQSASEGRAPVAVDTSTAVGIGRKNFKI